MDNSKQRAFSKSGPSLSRRDYLLIAAAVLFGCGIYLAASALIYRIGFPLDDAWIHAAYARNLALHGEWAFQLGRYSAGSTAPLWTLLLTLGFWFGLGPLWSSYALGAVALFALASAAEMVLRSLAATYHRRLPWMGLLVAAEWHMLWAAMSGMETAAHALLLTLVLGLLLTGSRRYLSLGLLTGLSVWVRPDGLTLIGPVTLIIVLTETAHQQRVRGLGSYFIGLGALLLPYLLLNLWLSGTPMPNTFYAKQAEYVTWQMRSPFYRAGLAAIQLLTGSTVLLAPGLLGSLLQGIRQRNARMLAVMLWSVLYIALYVMRLPIYQHARYLMPAMPVLMILGMLGYLSLRESHIFGRYQWSVGYAWQAGLAMLTLGFVVLGARAYGEDVGLIESEMVTTAKWVAQNVPAGRVVAAHDIGALGYFDEHPLIDLAGLVSPEVVPFMRDQARLAEYLNDRGVSYLIAFPDLYPDMVKMAKPVFSTAGQFAPAAGVANMTVYCWSCR